MQFSIAQFIGVIKQSQNFIHQVNHNTLIQLKLINDFHLDHSFAFKWICKIWLFPIRNYNHNYFIHGARGRKVKLRKKLIRNVILFKTCHGVTFLMIDFTELFASIVNPDIEFRKLYKVIRYDIHYANL